MRINAMLEKRMSLEEIAEKLMPALTDTRHDRRLAVFGASRIQLREMATIDYLYVSNWSLWSDVKILLRTIPYVLARRGQ